jgi:hypothetical protein
VRSISAFRDRAKGCRCSCASCRRQCANLSRGAPCFTCTARHFPQLLPARLGLDLTNRAIVEHDVWASIYNPGKMALLVAWTDAKAASLWTPSKVNGIEKLRHRSVRVVRDYGRFDRREAPQYYKDVRGRETLHPKPAR